MFEALPASVTVARPRLRAITSAVVLHEVLIAVAIAGTASSGVSAPVTARDTFRVDLAMTEERQQNASSLAPAPGLPSAPMVPNFATTVPKLDLPRLSFRGPVTAPAIVAVRAASSSALSGTPDSLLSLFRSSEVDELPQLLKDLHPEYPDLLRRAGLSGAVVVEYVIGRDGRIDSHSLQVLTTDHDQFTASVVQALRGARFKAARRAGQPVAVLVRQIIRFRSEMP
jgi:periplasmic protein TonB